MLKSGTLAVKPASLRRRTWVVTRLLRSLLITMAWLRIAPVDVRYREKYLPKKGAYLVAANHRSMWGPIFMWGALRRNATFIAMKELWKWQVLRQFLTQMGIIPVERGNRLSAKQVYEWCLAVLSLGGIVILYPEGGLTKGSQLKPFKEGVYNIAHAAGVVVVPVGDRVVPRNDRPRKWWKLIKRRKIILSFGRPLDPADYTGDTARADFLRDLAVAVAELSQLELPIT